MHLICQSVLFHIYESESKLQILDAVSLGRGLVTPASIFQWNDQTLADAFDQSFNSKMANLLATCTVFQTCSNSFFFPKLCELSTFVLKADLGPYLNFRF